MNTKTVNAEINALKRDLKAVNRARDTRLLKLALIMVILAVVAAFIYGRIQL
jgi:hypothetical protein